MNILSLFDGMACGMLAFQKAGVPVDTYTAYEIDKYAIQTATHNFPTIKECGDVFEADFTQYKDIDYIVGGSPCTYWSIAQKNNRETEASGLGWELFSQYVRAIKEVKPKFFIYENNKSMSAAIRQSISETFGFEPICINSALVSTQNRQRLYWVGKRNDDGTYSKVDVQQPEDRGILLKDILDTGCDLTTNNKAWTLTASYNGAVPWNTIERSQRNMVIEPVCVAERGRYGNDGIEQHYEAREDGKTNVLTTVQKDNNVAEPVGTTKDGKAYCLTAGYSNGSGENIGNYAAHTLEKGCKSMVAEPVNVTSDGKAQCLRATYYKDGIRNMVGNNIDKKTCVAEPIKVGEINGGGQGNRIYSIDGKSVSQTATSGGMGSSTGLYAIPLETDEKPVSEPIRVGALPRPNGELSTSQAMRVYSTEGKSVNLVSGGGGMGGKTGLYAIPVEFKDDKPTKAISCADGKTYTVYEVKDGQITIKGKQYPIKLADGYYIIRKLTVSECKRLQTVPEWYEFPVSDTQAYKMLGNGWTVDVIAHLIEATLK